MADEIIKVEPEPLPPQNDRYFPHNEKEGKGIGYAAIGIGVAAAIGLVGYGVYSGVSSSGQAITSCQNEYNAEVTTWNSYVQQFINEDVANNVPFPTPTQSAALNAITSQENSIATTCFKQNWVADAASVISDAFAIGIIAIFGAVAYAYIKKHGYLKPPKVTGGNGIPGAVNARVALGIIAYKRDTGTLPTAWDNSGVTSVNNIVAASSTQVQDFANEMVQLNLITAAEETALVTAESAIIEEDSLLVLALLA